MLTSVMAWASTHAKIFAVGLPLITGGIIGTIGYVNGVDDRLTAIEQDDTFHHEQLNTIERDVKEVRCMTILVHQGGDPLDCLNLDN